MDCTFKAKARAIDMLGRQQIAGVSTAISELFKNAFDAYATTVEVDYYLTEKILLLRDNGIGMTYDDFIEKWLSIGTESKLTIDIDEDTRFIPAGMNERPIMGEKGIGRLSMAAIGRMVLILSRAIREEGNHPVLIALVHWGMFEIPGVNLDEIIIPIEEYKKIELFTENELKKMKQSIKNNLKKLKNKVNKNKADNIIQDLDNFNLSPMNIYKSIGGPVLSERNHGVHFIIKPVSESLAQMVENNRNKKDEEDTFFKFLLGFSINSMKGIEKHAMETHFRVRPTKIPDDFEDKLEINEFFTHEDFNTADNFIKGHFDKNGQFIGTVRIYNETIENHIIPSPLNNITSCGSFNLQLGYIPGESKKSQLTPEQFTEFNRKLKRIGGVYVYRDGIRILPYGNSDYDWLEVEKRRTFKASHYYFSYRRMFGFIELTRKYNPGLTEKAGREGFMENRAFREVKQLLENFLVQLAADFFRNINEYYDRYSKKQEEIEKDEAARQKRNREAAKKRAEFRGKLETILNYFNEDYYREKMKDIFRKVRIDIQNRIEQKKLDTIIEDFLYLESEAQNQIMRVRKEFEIIKPEGIGLDTDLQRDWNFYLSTVEKFDTVFLKKINKNLRKLFEKEADKLKLGANIAARLQNTIKGLEKGFQSDLSEIIKQIQLKIKEIRDNAQKIITDSKNELDNETESIFNELAQLDNYKLSEKQDFYFESYSEEISQKAGNILSRMRSICEQLNMLVWEADEEGRILGLSEILSTRETDLLHLQEQAETDMMMIQLGQAVDVIEHEFSTTVQNMREVITHLKPWADINEDLQPLYKKIRNNFEHLDSYLKLFTPLQRRLYRQKEEIQGHEITRFIDNLFINKFERHSINFHATDSFNTYKLIGFRSSIYPVFVNLVDNAIFWLNSIRKKRKIIFDANETTMIIQDNGPGISERDSQYIFERGFTRKPGGRGLGLFVAKSTLNKAGYEISVDLRKDAIGASFLIYPNKETIHNEKS